MIPDKKEAARLFSVASEQGSAEAKFLLGQMYFAGDGVPKDRSIAQSLFSQSAELGFDLAKSLVEFLPEEKEETLTVEEVEEDFKNYNKNNQLQEEAQAKVEHLLRDLREGVAEAQFQIGTMYLRGDALYPDKKKGIILLKQAAEQDHTEAQYTAGLAISLEGTKPNLLTAAHYYEKAAIGGHAEAKYWLGAMHYHGMAIDKDRMKAAELFKEAAEGGSAEAMCKLAMMLVKGFDVTRDTTEAVRLLTNAAEKGHAESQYQLGMLFLTGEIVSPNHEEGERLLRLAADQDYAAAQYSLGEMYWKGIGVKVDRSEANKFYSAAAKNGHSAAHRNYCTVL